MKTIYFVVEFQTIADGLVEAVMCSENDLQNLLSNFDREEYRLLTVSTVGPIQLDYKAYIKNDPNLELGQ